jgi:PAS domain S-box-containing protein
MKPDTWLLKLLFSQDTAGIISRKLLPPLIILPIIIGWIRIHGERIGMFKSDEGVILVAVAYTSCFLVLTWLTARSIERVDRKRRSMEEALRESEERFKAIAEASPVGMGVVGEVDGKFLYINPAYQQYFGYDKDELLSKRSPDIYWNSDDREKIQEILKENNFVSNYEVRLKKKDGSLFWSMSSIMPINFINKPALLGTFIDITKRKQAEDSLRNSEQRLKSHIENSPLAVIEWGNDFIVTKWSVEAERIFGWNKSEVIGLRIDELNMIFEADIPIVEKTMERLTGGTELKVVSENRNYTKQREIRNCIWYNSVLLDEEGLMASVMSLIEDVTEIRKVEKLLKESEEKLWSVLNASQESVYVFDREGRFAMANSTGLKRLKKTAETELLGHHFSEFMPPLIARNRQKKLDEILSSGKPLEFEDERDGRMFNHNFFPIFKEDKVSSIVTYSTDITERKNAERILKESEDRFRTIAESLTVTISIIRISDSTVSFQNEPFEKLFGFKKGELLGKKLPDIYCYPDDFNCLVDILKIKGFVENMEIRVKKTDGTPFWIMTSIRKINFMNEPSFLTASIDITETKRSQEELLRLNRTLNAHSKSSKAMMHSKNELNYLHEVCKIIIEDCGHTLVWIGYARNDKRKSVKPVAYYGFDKGYVDQINITWDESERGLGPTGTAIRTGKPSMCKNMLTDPAFEPWREAAVERGFASSLVLPLKSEGKPFGAISIYSKEPDPFSESEIILLTELAEDLAYGISFIRLTESERAAARAVKESEASLKELIATKDKFFNIVAHDLKNPFTSLLGSSELLYENISLMTEENVRKLALILNDSAKGGYAILQNLLDWSRSQTGLLKYNPEYTNLRIIINENIDTLKLQLTNKGIMLRSELKDDFFIYADKNMINTILRNLLSNAVKYTFRNGTIVVSVSRSPEEIILTVKDSGLGISKDKVDNLFKIENSLSQPGTEKEQGTGLGLKLCKEFSDKMGGRIWAESNVGKGSEFKFTIPVA